MYPIVALTIALDEEFVEVFLSVISGIQQDGGIAYRLLHTYAADVYGTARQMVARISPANGPVHVRRAIATRDDDGFHVLRGLIVLARLQAVERIVRVSQLLQPRAQPFQILDRLAARDVPVQRFHTRLCKLPQSVIWGELSLQGSEGSGASAPKPSLFAQ